MTTRIIGAMALSAVVAGCSSPANEQTLENPPVVSGGDNSARPRMSTVRGCLTAAGDRFVLTQLERESAGAGAQQAGAATESYRLVGMEEQLRPLIGQRVEVNGDAEPETVVDMRGTTPATGTTATSSGADAKVSTTETAQLEVHDLRVSAVNALGGNCTAP